MEKKIDVLYAEDDDKMAKMVKNLLEDPEFHVRIACDGKRVWDVFQHSPPDLLLLDLEMPKKDGLKIVKLVRKVNKRVPIVFYSSYMNVEKELEAIKLGADDCIRKGCPIELLLEKLRSIYRRVVRDEGSPQIYFLSETTKFNAVTGLLVMNGKNLVLKSMDSRLLHLLCVKMHEIASNDYLIRGLWGMGYTEKGNALRKGITRLRSILEADASLMIGNSFGEGYFLTSRDLHLKV